MFGGARRATTHEREIVAETSIARPDGTLDRAAVGYSRTPVFDGRGAGRFPRRKRWVYWCVTTDTHLLSVTLADLDYAGLATAWFLDYATNDLVEAVFVSPLGLGFHLPSRVAGSDVSIVSPGLRVAIRETPANTRLELSFSRGGRTVDAGIDVGLPPGHETLSVVVPWDEKRFQLTSKHQARPAHGEAIVDGKRYAFDARGRAFGTLDFGCGVWPYATAWNWGSGSGLAGGRTVGWNLGGLWTRGTGVTENALVVDGKLHKIGEELVWEYDLDDPLAPWHVAAPRSGAVDLSFEPFHPKSHRMTIGVLSSALHLAFGRWSGSIATSDGEVIRVHDVVGWAEEHRARW